MPPAPAAAKIAAEDKIDLAPIAGSGKRGQVLKGDVLAAIARGSRARAGSSARASAHSCSAPLPPRAAPDESAREERVRMTKLRQTIARRLKDAQNTAAMLTTFNEVDMSEVMALRARYRDAFEKKHGAKLGFMGFFVKACVQALKEIPAVNAEIDGADLVYKNYYHIGIAVGTDKGLIVPVVRDADKLSIAEIEKAIARLGKRARDGQLTLEELQGGTFTITNGGIYGSLMSTPILNAPQSGHSRHAQDPGASDRRRRQGRDPADDVSGVELRPPHRRRPGGGHLPCPRQGGARRPGAAGARPLNVAGEASGGPAVGAGGEAMSELASLELAALLWLIHLFCQAGLSGRPQSWLISARDEPAPGQKLSPIAGRAARAFANYMESFPVFAALDLAFIATHHPAGIWPGLWIVTRIAYLPLYLTGVSHFRSIVWGLSIVALAAMLIRVAL